MDCSVRMLAQIVIEGNIRVQGGVCPALEHHLDGLVQRIHTGTGGAIAFRHFHIGAADGVGSGFARQILKGMDGVVAAFHHQGGADVGIGGAEVVGLLPGLGYIHAVDDHIIAAGFHTGKQAVPFALNKGGFYTQLPGNGLAHLHIVAHQSIAVIVEGPGGPVALQGNDQLTLFPDLVQPVRRSLLFTAGGQYRKGQARSQQPCNFLSHHSVSFLSSPRMVFRKARARSCLGF